MASNVKYAVSATPIVEVTNSEASGTWSAIAKDVGKTLGGSGSVTCTWGATEGYSAGDPTHAIATTATSLGTFSSIKFVFIKHSGYEEDSRETATTSTLAVLSGGVKFCELGPGDAVVLPFAVAATPVLTGTSSSGAIAVEVMGTA